ncbi:transglutaminaseTgpA domain-containing protein [Pseudomarimonas salicorniae]|uniref:DUF3488 and transglutaminase-like domain-containing protein n=1 Tax=Pseudomarimonas salicorniae TaxID=2933270 RepID=A0ABT0GJV4_9GAMM|nr:DUF3488 and transglutaminase-like domain-containing protein [Lysobacter sp. CAU 1642]MCK7594826.1 DUF3488 and transglutaminase-like domain-containing protein [Lysobacter sp. CAU 1642]
MSASLTPGARRWIVLTAASAVLPLGLVMPPGVQGPLLVCFVLGGTCALGGRLLPRALRVLLTFLALAAVVWLFQITAVGAFGRDAGSALLAVMLGMKLMETSTLRDARSCAVFGLFALMAAFLQDQGPVTLLLALFSGLLSVATLARLSAEECPGGQGALVEDERPRRRLRTAGWMLACSLPLAMAGFFLFPRLAQPLWGLPQNTEASRTGLAEDMSPGDISSLFVDDTPVMRVNFEGEIPPSPQRYFRGPVLSSFDGRRWTRGYIANVGPAPVVEGESVVNYTVEQEPTDRRYLFALDLAQAAPPDARFDHGRALRVERPLSSLRRETYRSTLDYRFEPVMMRTLQRGLSHLPDGFNPRAVALARQWREQHGSAEAIAQAALRWFSEEFTYTLEPPLLGRDSVDDFLFETRRGYCEHFSSAFTVLMRAAGIPARVVTGYQGGFVNPIGNYLIVRQSDAHAWSEIWIEGRGWLRVDPTNAVSPERIEQGTQALREETAWREAGAPLLNAVDWLRRGWNDWVLGFGAARQQQLLRPFGIDKADWGQLGIALVIAAGLALTATLVLLLRRPPDGEHPIDRAWHRLRARLRRAGYPVAVHMSPGETAGLLSAQPELQRLCQRYSTWAYAPPRRAEAEKTLLADLRRARVRRER